jgi:hypothetical protein
MLLSTPAAPPGPPLLRTMLPGRVLLSLPHFLRRFHSELLYSYFSSRRMLGTLLNSFYYCARSRFILMLVFLFHETLGPSTNCIYCRLHPNHRFISLFPTANPIYVLHKFFDQIIQANPARTRPFHGQTDRVNKCRNEHVNS